MAAVACKKHSGFRQRRQAVYIVQAILTPGAFKLVAVCQTSPKTVGQSLRALEAADHVGDIDRSRL